MQNFLWSLGSYFAVGITAFVLFVICASGIGCLKHKSRNSSSSDSSTDIENRQLPINYRRRVRTQALRQLYASTVKPTPVVHIPKPAQKATTETTVVAEINQRTVEGAPSSQSLKKRPGKTIIYNMSAVDGSAAGTSASSSNVTFRVVNEGVVKKNFATQTSPGLSVVEAEHRCYTYLSFPERTENFRHQADAPIHRCLRRHSTLDSVTQSEIFQYESATSSLSLSNISDTGAMDSSRTDDSISVSTIKRIPPNTLDLTIEQHF